MSVLHPTLLAAGLAAVALPILIHLLLRRRYTPIRWAAMRFVIAAHKQQRRRRKIEQILLLIARCLVVAMIAIAVARPLIGPNAPDRERTVVLIIDNGLGSSTQHADGSTDLDRSRTMALAEIDRLRPAMGDRVSVFTAGSPPNALIATPTFDLDAARRRIEAIEPEASAPDIAGALELASGGLDSDGEGVSIVIASGWRRGSIDALKRTGAGKGGIPGAPEAGLGGSMPIDTARQRPTPSDILVVTPVEEERANLRIIGVDIPRRVLLVGDTPAVRQAVIRIDRTGPATGAVAGEITCSLGLASSDHQGSSSVSVPFVIPEGSRETLVAIELPEVHRLGDAGQAATIASFAIRADAMADAIESDSRRLVGIRLTDAVDAGVIRSRGIRDDNTGISAEAWIGAALQPDQSTPVRTREITHGGLDTASLIGLDLIVLARPDLVSPGGWDAISSFVDAGGTLLLFTPPLDGAQAWTEDAEARMEGLAGLALEAHAVSGDGALVPGDASAKLGLLGAELADLAGSVRVSRALPVVADPSQIVLQTGSGVPVVVQTSDRVWLITTALAPSWSDIAARPIFPALIQEIARQSPSRGISMTVTAGKPVRLPARASRIKPISGVRTEPTDDTPAPGIRNAANGIRESGAFAALGTGDEPLGIIAVNADIAASDTATVSRETAEATLRDSFPDAFRWMDADESAEGAGPTRDRGLAFWAFAAAALLAVIESLLAFSAGRKSTLDPARTRPRGGRGNQATSPRTADRATDRSATTGAAA